MRGFGSLKMGRLGLALYKIPLLKNSKVVIGNQAAQGGDKGKPMRENDLFHVEKTDDDITD